MNEEWMSTKEIAEKMGVSQRTVRNLLEKDGVPVLRLSRKIKIRKADFEAFIDRRFQSHEARKES